MITHYSILAWRIPLTEEPARLQSMKFSRPEYWSGSLFPSPRDLPNPGIEPRTPALQADSLPTEPQRKLKNSGVGSHPFSSRSVAISYSRGIVPTQGLNLCLLHCRQILHPLSHRGTARLLSPWNSPSKNIGVNCHFFLQRIFQIQGSNLLASLALAGRFFMV